MRNVDEQYEVWVKGIQGWRIDRRTTFRDAKMCQEAYPDEVCIVPAPVMTAEAWVEEGM